MILELYSPDSDIYDVKAFDFEMNGHNSATRARRGIKKLSENNKYASEFNSEASKFMNSAVKVGSTTYTADATHTNKGEIDAKSSMIEKVFVSRFKLYSKT